MGTPTRNVLMVCIAAIATLATACSASPEPAPPPSSGSQTSESTNHEQRAVTFAVPTQEKSGEQLSSYSIVVGANTLHCSTKSNLELPLSGAVKGFSGDDITVRKFDGFVRINWDTMAAKAIIVNKQQWAPIDIGAQPPLATNLQTSDWGEITSITACN